MIKAYHDQSVEKDTLQGKEIAIIDYGSQGHAYAQNPKNNGCDVRVGIRPDDPSNKAKEDGLDAYPVAEAVKQADVIMVLLLDEVQGDAYKNGIAPNLETGNVLAFAHGSNIHFNVIELPKGIDAFLVAPRGPGHLVKHTFVEGSTVPALFGVRQDATGHTRDVALSHAKGIGATRVDVIEIVFKEETETDSFGEQAVLCGGTHRLIWSSFGILVEARYQKELAYLEVLHEMKLTVDLIYEGGMENVRYSISSTAEFGDYVPDPRVIAPDTKDNMKGVPKDIQDGNFVSHFIRDNENGSRELYELREWQHGYEIEAVGRGLRKMMPFIKSKSTQK